MSLISPPSLSPCSDGHSSVPAQNSPLQAPSRMYTILSLGHCISGTLLMLFSAALLLLHPRAPPCCTGVSEPQPGCAGPRQDHAEACPGSLHLCRQTGSGCGDAPAQAHSRMAVVAGRGREVGQDPGRPPCVALHSLQSADLGMGAHSDGPACQSIWNVVENLSLMVSDVQLEVTVSCGVCLY